MISPNLNIKQKLKPTQGFAHYFHLSFVALLPILVFIFVRLELTTVALVLILLSKWRIFAVRPHHWLAHFRTNAVDIIFSISMLAFISSTSSMSIQLAWVLAYEVWILFIKPGTNAFMVSVQALLAQLVGLIALFLAFEDVPLTAYLVGTAVILYFSARHYFGSFEERHFNTYSWIWTLFGVCLVWIQSHWLLFYGQVAQPAIILGVLGYGLAALYYLEETDKLSVPVRRQVIFVMVAIITVLLIMSDWGSQNI